MDNWDEIEIQDKLFTIDSLIRVIVISENDIEIKFCKLLITALKPQII